MGNFTDVIETWAVNVIEGTNKIHRYAGLAVLTGVVKKTPVADYAGGHHRGSWLCSIGNPDTSSISDITDKTGGQAISRGSSIISGVSGDSSIFINNSAPAINVLEYGGYPTRGSGTGNGKKTVGGYSKQAPAGMVRITVEDVNNKFSEIAERGGFTD